MYALQVTGEAADVHMAWDRIRLDPVAEPVGWEI